MHQAEVRLGPGGVRCGSGVQQGVRRGALRPSPAETAYGVLWLGLYGVFAEAQWR